MMYDPSWYVISFRDGQCLVCLQQWDRGFPAVAQKCFLGIYVSVGLPQ